MRVLWVVPHFPYPPDHGGKIRTYNLLKEMSKRHDVSLFATVERNDGVDIAALAPYCSQVYGVPFGIGRARETLNYLADSLLFWQALPYIFEKFAPPNVRQRFASVIEQERFDIIQFDHVQMSVLRSCVPQQHEARLILTVDNIETARHHGFYRAERQPLRKVGYYLQWLQVRRYETATLTEFDFDWCLTVSRENQDVLVQRFPKLARSIAVIPNGVDCAYFRRANAVGQSSASPHLVFVGSMDYVINEDAVLWFVESILPLVRARLPEVSFRVIGRNPSARVIALGSMGIEVTGTVEDIRPHLTQAAALVVPLRAGEGTRLKILEAMAAGIPVVSTSKGCEGLEVQHGRDLLVADIPETFAKCVIQLLENEALRRELASNGRGLVKERYDWSSIANQLDQVYHQVMART